MIPFTSVIGMASVVVAIAASGILGFVVYLSDPKSVTNRTLLLFAIVIILWNIFNFFVSMSLPPYVALWMLRLLIFFAVWLTFFLFQFFYVFPNDKVSFPPWFIYGMFPLTIATSVLTLTPLVFSGITEFSRDGKILSVANGAGIPVFGIVVVSLIMGSIFILLKDLRSASGIRKTQLQFILLGTASTFFLYVIFNFILPAFFNNPDFIPYGAIFTLPFISSTAYVIVKHRFLDIRLIVARAIAYLFTVVVLTFVYTGVIFWVSGLLFQAPPPTVQLVTYVFLTLFVAFTFQWLRGKLELVTDRIFFKGGYNINDVLSRLTRIMATTLHLQDITKQTLQILLDVLHVEHGTFAVFQGEKLYDTVSFGEKPIKVAYQDLNLLISEKRLIVFDEEQDGHVKDILRKLDMSVALPLFVEQKVEGILLLGVKQSGDIYSSQDISLLEIFGSEVSVAIQNAKSYEEIERFNVTLKEEVEKATKDLKIANEKLKELDKLKDDFVSVASHELRTPMTAIKSYLWMALAGKGGKLNEKQTYYLERSYNSVDRLIKLVNDMLNISRIESGRLTVSFQKVDIRKLAQEVIEEVLPRAAELGVSVNLEGKTSSQVVADPDKIKEVLFNLIGNSLKFTPKKGKITVTLTKGKAETTIWVSDNGVGIAKEDLPKLFHRFGMIAGSYTTNQPAQGTGLGLYISKSIVEIHGGTIKATSGGKGKGATFTFTLQNFSDALLTRMNKKYGTHGAKDEIGIIHTALT